MECAYIKTDGEPDFSALSVAQLRDKFLWDLDDATGAAQKRLMDTFHLSKDFQALFIPMWRTFLDNHLPSEDDKKLPD